MKYNSLDDNVVAGSGFDRRHDLCKCAWGHPSLQEVARVANHRECLPGTSLAIRNDCSCVIRQFGNLNIYIISGRIPVVIPPGVRTSDRSACFFTSYTLEGGEGGTRNSMCIY